MWSYKPGLLQSYKSRWWNLGDILFEAQAGYMVETSSWWVGTYLVHDWFHLFMVQVDYRLFGIGSCMVDALVYGKFRCMVDELVYGTSWLQVEYKLMHDWCIV